MSMALSAVGTLEQSIYIALFSDARANGQRGWWADPLRDNPLGSTIWAVPQTNLPANVQQIAQRARARLQKLVDSGAVDAIDAQAVVIDNALHITVTATRKSAQESYTWQA